MDEMELIETLKGFKQALDYLHEENKALNSKIDELSTVLYDDLLSPVQESIRFAQDEENFGKFKENYGSSFEPYANDYNALYNGNDIARDVYDTYNEHSEEYDEAMFVEEAIKSIAATIQETKEKLGIPTEEKVEITETEDGIKVETEDGEVVAEVEENGEIVAEENASEANATPESEEETVEEETVDSPEEIAAFEAELEKQLR
jgi:hypothetical protein